MPTWVAALIALAAIAAVYFFCMRPMRKGTCAMSGSAVPGDQEAERANDAELARQIAGLREEVRVLRAQRTVDDHR